MQITFHSYLYWAQLIIVVVVRDVCWIFGSLCQIVYMLMLVLPYLCTYIAYIHQNADDHIHTIIALMIFYGMVSNTHARTHDELRIVDRRKRHNIIYIHLIHTPMKMRWGLWTGSTGVMRVMFPNTNGRVIRVGLMMVEWHGNGMMMACLLALLLFEWRHESI